MKSRITMWTTTTTLLAALAMPVGMAAQDNATQNHHPHHRYKLILPDTFGGPQSYSTAGSVLSPGGTAMGWADTAVADPYSPNCFNPDCFVSHTFQWQNGVLTDLGALPGVNSSGPNWMTTNRLVAGSSQNSLVDPLTGFPEIRAVLWRNGRITDLGTLGGNESGAVGANTRGQVVGGAANSIPDQFSDFWFGWGTQTRAFRWQNGTMVDLGTLGGPDAFAATINDAGQIAGQSYTSSIPNATTGQPTLDPFLWQHGSMVDLGGLGGTLTFVAEINNRGQIIGQSNLPGDATFHPVLWERGRVIDLGTFGGDNGTTNAINDAGEIIGNAELPGSQTHEGFLWKRGRLIDLGTVAGDSCSNAWGINSKEQVVGNSSDCITPLHGFLWENGGPMVDINLLISPPSDFEIFNTLNINDRGEITGDGLLPDGNARSFVLIPCDEHHPGMCDDYSLIEVPAGAVSASQPMKSLSYSRGLPAGRRSSNKMAERYHLPGAGASARE